MKGIKSTTVEFAKFMQSCKWVSSGLGIIPRGWDKIDNEERCRWINIAEKVSMMIREQSQTTMEEFSRPDNF